MRVGRPEVAGNRCASAEWADGRFARTRPASRETRDVVAMAMVVTHRTHSLSWRKLRRRKRGTSEHSEQSSIRGSITFRRRRRQKTEDTTRARTSWSSGARPS